MNRLNYFLISALLFSMALYIFFFLMRMADLQSIWDVIKAAFLPCLLALLFMLMLLASLYVFIRAINQGKPKKHIRFR